MPKLSISTIEVDDNDEGTTDVESGASTPIITIPEHLNSLRGSMTNYDNITDGNFGTIFLNKTKRQFTQKSQRGLTLGVKLVYFKNEARKTFTKLFVYNKDPDLEPDNVLTKILSEVYYHLEFSKLQGTCGFRVPTLLNYGFIERNNDMSINIRPSEYMFFIEMEDVEALPVTNLNEIYNDSEITDVCFDIEKEVERIDACLQKYNLHHNDLHSDNIMIDKKTKEIIVIDFGEATDHLIKISEPVMLCSKFTSKIANGKFGGYTSIKRRRNTKKRNHESKKRRQSKKKRKTKKGKRDFKKGRISKKRKI